MSRKENLKKSRWMVLVAIALIVAVAISGCGGSSYDSTSADSSGTDALSSEPEDVAEDQGEDEVEDESNEITFDEMTIVDNDECSIILSDYSETSSGCTIKAELENKSSEITYMFAIDDGAVNGVTSDPFFATTVAPGKISNETISFSDSDLIDNGIGEFTDIEIAFRVYDYDDWTADAAFEETIHVYPYGEENATQYVRESQDTDIVIVDNDYVTAIVTGFEPDGFWGYTVNLFLLNKTDSEAMFSADDVSVNGYMCDPFFASSVSEGNCEFTSMSWSDSDFEDNGIEDVEEIEMQFRAYNYDDWSADDYFNETVTLNP